MPHRSEPPWGVKSFQFPSGDGEPPRFGRWILGIVTIFVLIVINAASTYVVEPGTRGIKVTLGKVDSRSLSEGFGFKPPFITSIVPISVRQQTLPVKAACFSSDLQQVGMDLRVLYRIPAESVIEIYKQFSGDPFHSLIAPRVQEALKEITAAQTAEQIVRYRRGVKQRALATSRAKVGKLLWIEDIVIRDIDLSAELERAIEAKMVAEQQAAQARFTQLQTQVEAQTAVISAKGEAEGIRVRGEALKLNPMFLRLRIVERWNGKSPLVVPADGAGAMTGLLLPIGAPRTATP